MHAARILVHFALFWSPPPCPTSIPFTLTYTTLCTYCADDVVGCIAVLYLFAALMVSWLYDGSSSTPLKVLLREYSPRYDTRYHSPLTDFRSSRTALYTNKSCSPEHVSFGFGTTFVAGLPRFEDRSRGSVILCHDTLRWTPGKGRSRTVPYRSVQPPEPSNNQ